MRKFWNFRSIKNEETQEIETELRIDGYIAEDSWFDDDVTPAQFRAELETSQGNIILWINSYGGDAFAGSQIYTAIQEIKQKKKCSVTVKVDGVAASAASVICMAGTEVLMSPTAAIMIHNPWTLAIGEVSDLEKSIDILNEVKDCIINAYQLKTGLSRAKLSHLMDLETWMNAGKAIELGFADGMLYTGVEEQTTDEADPFMWNAKSTVFKVAAAMRKKFNSKSQATKAPVDKPQDAVGTPIEQLEKRLSLLMP